VFRIDENYITKLNELPTPADKAAALEGMLTAELSEDDPSFIYRQLGERLQRVRERKDAGDEATARRLRELEEIAAAAATTKQEPERLDLLQPGEYGLFTILRAHAASSDEKLSCGLRPTDGRTSAQAQKTVAWLEYLHWRADACRAIAAGRILELPGARLRPRRREPTILEASGQ